MRTLAHTNTNRVQNTFKITFRVNRFAALLQVVDDDEDVTATVKVPQKRKRAWEEAAEAQDPEALEAARKEKEMEEDQREKEEFEQRMRVRQGPILALVVWCRAAAYGSARWCGCWWWGAGTSLMTSQERHKATWGCHWGCMPSLFSRAQADYNTAGLDMATMQILLRQGAPSACNFRAMTDVKGTPMTSVSWVKIGENAHTQVPLRCPALASTHLQCTTGVA